MIFLQQFPLHTSIIPYKIFFKYIYDYVSFPISLTYKAQCFFLKFPFKETLRVILFHLMHMSVCFCVSVCFLNKWKKKGKKKEENEFLKVFKFMWNLFTEIKHSNKYLDNDNNEKIKKQLIVIIQLVVKSFYYV